MSDAAVDTTRLLHAYVLLYFGFLRGEEQKEFEPQFNAVLKHRSVSVESKKRIAEMHQELRHKKMTKEGCDRKMILDLYVAVLPLLEAYTVLLESKEPLIHKLLDQQEKLIREFLVCFLMPEAFNDLSIKKICELDLAKNLQPKSDFFLGRAREFVSMHPKSATVRTFLEQTKNAYLTCAAYLLKRMPFLQCAQAIDPICRGHSPVLRKMEKLGDLMSVLLTEEERQTYSREWKNISTSPVDKDLCRNIMASWRTYNACLASQKEATAAVADTLKAPAPASAATKRKYSSMMDFVSKKARLDHAASQTKDTC
ncbi:hypothetical protein BaRGS_00036921 [Batillaria attramentaria]|uniref:Uncharacterized protein n=1 Tax=Batillaria attramentaria TaxID=370345 RepID=A0ABD0JAG0_9CAEN